VECLVKRCVFIYKFKHIGLNSEVTASLRQFAIIRRWIAPARLLGRPESEQFIKNRFIQDLFIEGRLIDEVRSAPLVSVIDLPVRNPLRNNTLFF